MTNSTNEIRGNEIAMYDRSENGDLSLIGFFPTGELSEGKPQLGSGPAPTMRILNDFTPPLPLVATNLDGLGSSHSVILSPDNKCLYAVNAGSNSLSSFRVRRNGLSLVSVEDSRGTFPVSLTVYGDTLFVLNSGITPNSGPQGTIAGLQVADDCSLTPIKNSVFSLTGLSQTYDNPPPGENLTTPGQVSFTPDGALLLLSIKGNFNPSPPNVPFPGVFPNGRVVVFPVVGKAKLGAAVVTDFSFTDGTGGPFSFVFSGPRTLVMVHVNSSTVAAYSINSSNKLTRVSNIVAPVPPKGPPHFATCWIVISGNYVYAASFDQPTGVLQIMGAPDDPPDLDGAINGFQILKNPSQSGGLTLKQIVDFAYPSPSTASPPSPPNATGNHAIDLAAIENWVYFIQPRTGMIGRLTINSRTGSLSDLAQFGGLDPGPEPWATLNPAINTFLTKCFMPNPDAQCKLGSAQGITGF